MGQNTPDTLEESINYLRSEGKSIDEICNELDSSYEEIESVIEECGLDNLYYHTYPPIDGENDNNYTNEFTGFNHASEKTNENTENNVNNVNIENKDNDSFPRPHFNIPSFLSAYIDYDYGTLYLKNWIRQFKYTQPIKVESLTNNNVTKIMLINKDKKATAIISELNLDTEKKIIDMLEDDFVVEYEE